jgi:hypothetical protein
MVISSWYQQEDELVYALQSVCHAAPQTNRNTHRAVAGATD